MRNKHIFFVPLAALTINSIGYGQSTIFQDLSFEDANVVPIVGQPYAVTTANALPGWTVDYGAAQQSQITYNEVSLGGTAATLIANGYPTLTGLTPIDGSFSVELYGGSIGGVRTPASIDQTGLIPAGTQSLVFDGASPFSGAPPPDVSVGSENLTLFSIGSGTGSSGQSYDIYGANISQWAGQTEDLSFTVPGGYGSYLIDDISFSPNAITVTPEPDALTLMSIGGLLFGLYRRLQARRK